MPEVNIPVTTHGRLLIDGTASAGPLKLLAGCHGYAQNADDMMEMLRSIPAGAGWTRLSIQALHRFYRRPRGSWNPTDPLSRPSSSGNSHFRTPSYT